MACLLLLLTAIAGCGLWTSQASDESARPTGTRLDVPDGLIAVITWLPDGYVYFHWTPDLGGDPYRLMRARPGEAAEPVELPQIAGCQRTEDVAPHRLPDGRLGLARACLSDIGDGFTLIAYQPTTGRVEELAAVGRDLPTSVSWRRNLDGGYLSAGSGICDGFAPITRHGVGEFPGPVSLDGHAWRLDEIFRQTGADSCKDQGRAGPAMLTPDNRQLIFAAAPEAQGADGQGRMDAPSQIYRQDLPAGLPDKLASGFIDLIGMDISPDGRHLAVAGKRGRDRGLWLINLDSGDLRKIVEGPLKYPSFSPDGKHLAVVFTPEGVEKAQLRVLDVPT
jgi:hypothetical protein